MQRIRDFLLRLATPFTVGLFLVSAVSGVALYFGVLPNVFHGMHEVLSMVLLVPVVLHIWRNWRAFGSYFRRAMMPLALAVSVVWAGYYAYGAMTTTSTGGNPARAVVGAVQRAPLSALAPVLQLDEASLVQRLGDAGFSDVKMTDSIAKLAAASGRNSMEILVTLTSPAR